jgi:hypothetical protein
VVTLSSNSTVAEVWTPYDENGSYEQDNSRTRALAFVSLCRILRRRLPLSAGRRLQTVTRESLDAEIEAARARLDDHPEANPVVGIRNPVERKAMILPGEDASGTLANVGGDVSIVVLARQGLVCTSNWIPAWNCGLARRRHGRRFRWLNWWKGS